LSIRDGVNLFSVCLGFVSEPSNPTIWQEKSEQRPESGNVDYMSGFVLFMALPESQIGFPSILAHAADVAPDAACSAVEEEVIELFDEYRRRLLRYVMSIGLTAGHGEEIVQDVFLALFRHLRMGRPKDNLRGWIFRVAHNLALKTRMSEQTRPDRAEFDDVVATAQADPRPNPEQQLASVQRQRILMATMRALPERDQYCLNLRAEGLRYREIAEILEMSLGGVANSLSRSLARLERADQSL
jgi:RNA polymerase sigma-70 factor (ECF subfamily)